MNHGDDGGVAAEGEAENRRVEAAAGRAAELSVVSNPSITDPAISQVGGGSHGVAMGRFNDSSNAKFGINRIVL